VGEPFPDIHPCVLDVRRSLKNSRWVFPAAEQDAVDRIARDHGLPDFVARLLHTRGVAVDQVLSFLHPTLRDHFPDPFSLAGMDALAGEMADVIASRTPIGIFADFDVDGATSAAILTRFLRHVGIDPPVYIPDRLSEGYGPSREGLEALKDKGAQWVIMADCGITAFEPIADGRAMGLNLIVLDHHEPEATLPPAHHVINPKRHDDTSGLGMLAACGVSFMTCIAINAALRRNGFYAATGRSEAPLKDWLDIVALGTVCDMVPMLGPNRLFVRAGFQQMAQTKNAGIRALLGVANVQGVPEPTHAGFSLGPRINAGSRVHRSDLGARLLSTDDAEEASSIAWTLEACNKERRAIQTSMMEQAIQKVERDGLDRHAVIVVSDPDWHPGLAGLVAGRLKERFGKPAVVVTFADNRDGVQEGRGSGRSIPGVNIAQVFIAARNEGILTKGGGHAMAGGFTLLPDRLPEFRDFLHRHVEDQVQGFADFEAVTSIDALATVQAAQADFIKLVTRNAGPFGMGHPEPVFALAGVRLWAVDVLKDKHIRAQIGDWEGGKRIKAMLFSGVGTSLGDAILNRGARPMHLAGQFQLNLWQGRESVEFHIVDGAEAMI